MLTEARKRVARAQTLLNSGMDAKAVAKECGYKNVNGMMGAIALHGRHEENKQEEFVSAAVEMKKDNAAQMTVQVEQDAPPMQVRAAAVDERRMTLSRPTIEIDSVRLQYDTVTESVLLTQPGSTRYFWFRQNQEHSIIRQMKLLRTAADQMIELIEARKGE